MIQRLILLAVAIVGGCVSLEAQSLEGFKSQLAAPHSSPETTPSATVEVREHGSAAEIVLAASHSARRLRLRGFRVCIFFDNGPDARAGAVAARDLFVASYPDIKAYMVYENPYFKVSVGNCLSSEEAIILKGKVDALFPKAFVKNEEFSIADLLE